MIEIHWIISFLVLGSIVGFLAGLFGIGGGGIMVPVLTSIFLMMGISSDKVIHIALGTSMAAIIVTSFSSLMSHHKHHAVDWNIVKSMVLGVILGTFLATFLVAFLNSLFLALFFAIFMGFVATQMFLNKSPKPSRQLSKPSILMLVGSGIGAISALVSIGGGSMTVPYLTWQNINIKKAIGTSAAIGFPLAIAGTIGYVFNGWDQSLDSHYQLGFVYWPAVVLISMTSYFTAPLGASLAHKMNVSSLKKVFALLLILLSIKMFVSIL